MKYRLIQREHSAILLTFIKQPFVIKILVLAIFEGPFTQVLLYVLHVFMLYVLSLQHLNMFIYGIQTLSIILLDQNTLECLHIELQLL